MKEINIFCFGFGQVAKNFIRKVNSENIKINLTVTSREKSDKKNFDGLDYEKLQFSENSFDKKLIENLKSSNHILISIAPVSGEDIVIKNFKSIFDNSKIKWITYLSATSVYGNHNGDWVNENSKTNPTSANGIARLNAEKSWLDLTEKQNLPLQILRLSGIYSNQNNILARLKTGNVKIIDKKNQFFSRIHTDDIAQALVKSIEQPSSGEVYNICDDYPCSNEEVTVYAANLLKVPIPQKIKVDTIENEMSKSFYKDSKRVKNTKMKENLKVKLKYPTYKEGLSNICSHLS